MKRAITFFTLFVLVLSVSCASNSLRTRKQGQAKLRLGVSYLQQGKNSLALNEFFKGEKLFPDDPEMKNAIGLTYMRMRNYEKAEKYPKEAVALKKDFSEAYNNLGLLYSTMGRSEEAIKNYKKALENVLYSTPERAYNNLGIEYEKKGEIGMAKKAYIRAMNISPTFPLPSFNLGRVLLAEGNLDGAINQFRKAISLHSGYVSAYFQLGKAYLKKKDYKRALVNFKAVERMSTTGEVKEMAREYIDLIEK